MPLPRHRHGGSQYQYREREGESVEVQGFQVQCHLYSKSRRLLVFWRGEGLQPS